MAEMVLHAAAPIPASDFHLSQTPVPLLEPALRGTTATPGTLLTPPCGTVAAHSSGGAPATGAQAHPVPPIHGVTLAASSMGVCSVPNSASLAQSP